MKLIYSGRTHSDFEINNEVVRVTNDLKEVISGHSVLSNGQLLNRIWRWSKCF
jgi:hypothetical protein